MFFGSQKEGEPHAMKSWHLERKEDTVSVLGQDKGYIL